MESKEDNNTTTTGGSGSKKEMSRVEKKALARVWSTSGQKSDFTTPKDGFMSTDITSLIALGICIGYDLPLSSLFPLFFFFNNTHTHTQCFADPRISVCLRRRVSLCLPGDERLHFVRYITSLEFFF